MSNTKIEWTDKRWNPITGCSPISAGCDHCYAQRMAQRLAGRFGYPADDPFRVTFHPDRLELPLHWRKPSKIFVNSMGDLFYDSVKGVWLDRIIKIIEATPHHIYQILTKRIESCWTKTYWQTRLFRNNVWIGVTVESTATKNRIDILREVRAKTRFVSFEPLIGDVGELDLTGIHWVIVGGETGPGARPFMPRWAYNILGQCERKQIPFFFKKHGSYSGAPKPPNDIKLAGRIRREFPQTR